MVLILCSACKEQERSKIYLEEAKYYIMEKDWRAAISQLQNFIAIENEASIQERAEAWFLLADVRLALNQLKESYEVLEYMLEDPDYDLHVRSEVYKRLIKLYDRVNLHAKAAIVRKSYALQKHISPKESALILMEAAKSYQIISDYKQSLRMLEDALNYIQNIGSNLDKGSELKNTRLLSLKAHIYYYRAYAQNVLEQTELALISLYLALEALNDLENHATESLNSTHSLEGNEQETNDIFHAILSDKQLRGLIYYLLADILEIEGDINKSYKYFILALDHYPNRLFIQKRVDLLEEKYTKDLTKNKDK